MRRAAKAVASSPRLLKGSLALLGLLLLAWCAARVWMPPPRPFAQLTFSRAFLDTDGRLLRLTVAADGRYRLWTPLSALAPALIQATVAKEDRRFRLHVGVDPIAVARAALGLSAGGRSGASTITMQLARLLWRLDTRSISGKLRQMLRAVALEVVWSKDEILEAYLNLAPYGGNVEGAGAAAWIYFGKRPADLSRAEALRLALVPQSPARRGALLARGIGARSEAALHPASIGARDPALEALAAAISPDAATAAVLARDAASLTTQSRAALPSRAPHLVDRLRAELPSPAAREDGAVRTTLDLALQETVERQIRLHLATLRKVGIDNAAAILVHRPSRAVRAYVGSADFDDVGISGQVDGVRARRSPGSTLKPFLYARALDQGLIHPASLLLDVPSDFGAYDPENFDHSYLGPVDATTALVASRNVPAIELLNRVTVPDFCRLLRDGGVRLRYGPERYGLTLAVGGAEVSMEELAVLYGALGDGRATPLAFVPGHPAVGPTILSPAAAFMTRTMLSDNPRPADSVTGNRRGIARASPLTVAWKTGTSFGMRDAWAVGLAGEWIVGVWLGDFRSRPNPALVGRDAAGPLLFRIVESLAAERPVETLAAFPAAPKTAKKIMVCALSGGLPGPACKAKKATWFLPGVSPAHVCPIHRLVDVRLASGLGACRPGGGPTVKRAFEFWPSDALRAFARLGVPRLAPPTLEPGCALTADARGTTPLQILSPRRNVVYPVPVGEGAMIGPILLAARAAPDAGRVYWFLDETLLGDTAPGETLAWVPKPGKYMVRAVDARGASDVREMTVVATR